MKKAILFDLDGTLIDSTDAILKGFDAAFAAMGEEKRDHELIKPLIGHTLEDMFESLGVRENIKSFVASYRSFYHDIYLDSTSLLPNASQAIKLAASFADLCVVTTKSSRSSRILLKHLGVLDFFKFIVGREDVDHPKPNPEPVNLALLKLKANKNYSFMIGDTALDMQAAKAAGIRGLAVSCGYGFSLCKQNINIFSDANEAVFYIKSFTI